MKTHLSLLLVAFAASVANAMTTCRYDDIVTFMSDYFRGNDELPIAVRLAFHDCVGGCDGCVNTDNPSNAGLQGFIETLLTVRTDNDFTDVSVADFFMITSIAAIERGIANAVRNGAVINSHSIVFKSGRVDAPDCLDEAPFTDVTRDFPAPTMTGPEVFDYFDTSFNFNSDEVVALLGAHSLGRASRENSGYNGPWTPGATNRLDNDFYVNFFDESLVFEAESASGNAADPKWQLRADDGSMMLNSDFGMIYDLVLDDEFKATCNASFEGNVCTHEDGYDMALEYAENVNTWIDNFSAVFTKMIENGYEDGSLKDLVYYDV